MSTIRARLVKKALQSVLMSAVQNWVELGYKYESPKAVVESGRFVEAFANTVAAVDSETKQITLYRYECYPDTLDPRGPKGK